MRTNTALLGGERKTVTTSIGVAMFDTNVEELTGETIVIEADLAMYDAKEAGRDGYAFYATSEHRVSRTKARLTWVSRIEQALEDDRFVLLAQPILDLHTGEIRQHELLVRMLDDHDDLIPPAAFLYIAERFGLIARLDEWVATHAIELIEQRPELQLEVNISGRSLGDRKLLHAIDDRLRASSHRSRAADLRGHRDGRRREHHPRPSVRAAPARPRLPLRARRLRRRLRLLLLPQAPAVRLRQDRRRVRPARRPADTSTSSSSKRSSASPEASARRRSPSSSTDEKTKRIGHTTRSRLRPGLPHRQTSPRRRATRTTSPHPYSR